MTRHSIPAFLTFAVCAVAGLLLLALSPSSVDAQGVGICPSTMPSGSNGLVCQCAGSDGDSAVWGTDSYTDDSNICNAAVHAGAIPATGGTISVRTLPGRDYYTGSRRNGIETRDYGRWGRSIGFDGPPSVADGLEAAPLCPGGYNAGGTAWSGSCRCVGVDQFTVWGTGTYTADSSVCRAALHAGVIGAGGGLVRVTPAPGQASYPGSTRNGVTTSSWGSYGASFRVSR